MAEREDGHVELPAEEARQGKKLGVMRYVLLVSLVLAVIAGVTTFASIKH